MWNILALHDAGMYALGRKKGLRAVDREPHYHWARNVGIEPKHQAEMFLSLGIL